jgi:hypothetical protein
MNTLVESLQFDLVHDPGCGCLYATWRGPHSLTRTQANYELILDSVQATHSQKLLNDTLLDQDGWHELTHWLAQDCFPRLTKQGVVAVAWVLPRNEKALYAARGVLNKLTQPLIETFGDAEAAYTWLQQWPMSGKRDFPLVIL